MKLLIIDLWFKIAVTGILIYFLVLLLNEPILLHEEDKLILDIEFLLMLCLIGYMIVSIASNCKKA